MTIPAIVKEWLKTWTDYAHQASSGRSGYTASNSFPWGPYATTPSGTVQMVWEGIGRGTLLWDTSENFQRANLCNGGGAGNAIRDYYYGLFSFTKSMLLHDPDGDGLSNPLADLECRGPSPCALSPIDWYEAQASAGDQCDGVARTLVNDQSSVGYWYAHNFTGSQYPFETGWAIVMLNRTVFASGLPVAVAHATPNPGVAGQTITLDGSSSFHQDPSKNIISWEWDLDNDGAFDDATGPVTSTSFPAVGNYPVGLQACDDATPQACDDTVVTVIIDTPPLAPTADADGPYAFCPQTQPWFLDGTGSVNPDEGQSELVGLPGDTILEYAWELDGDNQFDDAFGSQPDVTAFYTALGVGDYLAQLRVTDATSISFPSSGFGNLSDTDATQVSVKSAADPACACVGDLAARPKRSKVQLTWSHTGAFSYNVYRSTTSGGPYTLIANTTSSFSTYLDVNVVLGNTYYYVVREVALNTDERCQSNEASATLRTRR